MVFNLRSESGMGANYDRWLSSGVPLVSGTGHIEAARCGQRVLGFLPAMEQALLSQVKARGLFYRSVPVGFIRSFADATLGMLDTRSHAAVLGVYRRVIPWKHSLFGAALPSVVEYVGDEWCARENASLERKGWLLYRELCWLVDLVPVETAQSIETKRLAWEKLTGK